MMQSTPATATNTILEIEQFVKALDDLIMFGLLPTLFGSPPTQAKRKVVALLTRYRKIGVSSRHKNSCI